MAPEYMEIAGAHLPGRMEMTLDISVLRHLLASAAVAATLTGPASAGEHDATVLTVSGDGDLLSFTRGDLEALGTETFTTSTIWTDGPQTFTGMLLAALTAAIGVNDGSLRASAINDYSVLIPVSDGVAGGPIIAFLRNGEPMSVRERGPLWLVYPFDSSPKYQTEVIYSRSIWQLDRIAVVE